MLAALSQAIEACDPYTRGHSNRVTVLAETVARRLQWSDGRLRTLHVGGLLHDVGKLSLDVSVLRKPGPLNERERDAVSRHPLAGAKLIRPFPTLRPALPYVLYHHEWWDGSGYPSGRSREQIPVGARILAVADAFDAMTSARPYRPPRPPAAAIHELVRCAGTQFDPGITRAFVQAWYEGELRTLFEESRLAEEPGIEPLRLAG